MGRRAGVTAEETRAELLAAAVSVVRARGYEGTRVSEIAREAGVTTGAMYAHFSSKAELLAAAIAEHGPAVLRDVLAADGDVSVLETARALGSAWPDSVLDGAPLLVELVAAASRDREVAAVLRSVIGAREAAVAEAARLGQRVGEIDPTLDPGSVARFAVALALGSLVLANVDADRADPDGWRAVVDRMVDAVRPPEPT